MTQLDRVAREGATQLWNEVPCGRIDGKDEDLAYFLKLERQRYLEQWWQRDCFRFEEYKGKRVLEIGIGHGTDLVQFAKAGSICHGADIADKHLELTARNFSLRGLQVQLLGRFQNVHTTVRHMSLGRFGRSSIGRLFKSMLDATERYLGWYVCVRATRRGTGP